MVVDSKTICQSSTHLLAAFVLTCLIVVVSDALDSSSTNISYECKLVNEEYRGETLIAAPISLLKSNFFTHGVFTWRLPSAKSEQLNVDLFKAEGKLALWQLVPLDARPNTFFMHNAEYGEYLHASAFHTSLLRHRRFVYMWKWSSSASRQHEIDSDEAYMWTLKEPFGEGGGEGGYEHLLVTVWNVKFNEALYATSRHHRERMFSRHVFTWHNAPDSKQFNWFLKCRDDHHPLLNKTSYFNNNNNFDNN